MFLSENTFSPYAQVESLSALIAIISLVYLPAARVWRSIGYDKSPGMVINTLVYVGAGMYSFATARYLVPAFPPTSAWIA